MVTPAVQSIEAFDGITPSSQFFQDENGETPGGSGSCDNECHIGDAYWTHWLFSFCPYDERDRGPRTGPVDFRDVLITALKKIVFPSVIGWQNFNRTHSTQATASAMITTTVRFLRLTI